MGQNRYEMQNVPEGTSAYSPVGEKSNISLSENADEDNYDYE
jgi:hypothetical protein